ncbi:hypothetical protein HDU80_003122 [Chytriomyces hyalinus]|nr:hypothetical protein HDU80_003122 [Chytriomyces hyalinus]
MRQGTLGRARTWIQDLVRTGRGSLVPDLTPLETLLRIIGEDHRWTDIEVEGDISKLTDYRVRSVKDVRALKDRAWEEMKGVLPITKDLLRTAVGWMPKRQ